MVTEAQNLYNLRTARARALVGLGLPEDASNASLDFEVRKAVTAAIAADVLKYPASFTEQTVKAAAITLEGDYGSMNAVGAPSQVVEFFELTLENAVDVGDSVADIGRGAQAAASTLGAVMPLLVLGGAAILLYSLYRRTA